MGLIWLKYPILWHSSRQASYNFTAMTPEERVMVTAKWTFWYEADWDYGHPTVIFFCAAVACSLLLNLVFWSRNRSSSKEALTSTAKPSTIIDRITATIRYTIARQYRIRAFHWYTPPLAAIIAVSGMFIFIFALMLGPHPYVWPNIHAMGHSPPIATRSGWLSIAIMPFMIAFATKVNFITMLTGTSHEKLQVFHRWSALVMYITSLVHTFPFVVQAFQLDEMEIQWKTNWYWTGVAALVPQTYLVFLSWGLFRNKYYETFKKLHFLAAALFMVFLFIHCCFRLTSWDYFAATAAIYFLAWFFRFFRSLYNTGLGVPASIEVLPDGRTLKLTVLTPSRVKWSPGQHVFLRFLNSGIHVFSSHPFTISSLSSDGAMEFVFNIHGGVTRKLAAMAEGKASVSTRVIVDGPYGGVPSLEGYDHVYLLAGGTGVSLTLPLLSNLVKAKGKSKSVEFVVAVKKRETATWIEDQVSNKHMDNLTRRIHITDPEEQSGMPKLLKGGGSENSSLSEKGKKSTGSDSEVQLISGRPNLPSLIHEAHRTQSGKTAVIACGPESFLYDVRNAVAEAQLVLADGYGACTDLFLHTETYNW